MLTNRLLIANDEWERANPLQYMRDNKLLAIVSNLVDICPVMQGWPNEHRIDEIVNYIKYYAKISHTRRKM